MTKQQLISKYLRPYTTQQLLDFYNKLKNDYHKGRELTNSNYLLINREFLMNIIIDDFFREKVRGRANYKNQKYYWNEKMLESNVNYYLKGK